VSRVTRKRGVSVSSAYRSDMKKALDGQPLLFKRRKERKIRMSEDSKIGMSSRILRTDIPFMKTIPTRKKEERKQVGIEGKSDIF
jgi:hypothetical protein